MPERPVPHEDIADLIESAAAVAGQPDLRDVLRTTIERGMELTGATYGALGVVGPDGSLVEFHHAGMNSEIVARIGRFPEGRGILGLITKRGETIRVDKISDHTDFAGFPQHHPAMETFLGVPIRVGTQIFGNLYLTEKPGGFNRSDEALMESLAVIAGSAISNARIHDRLLSAALVEDRARIARDLHDAIIQELYAVGLTLQGVSGSVPDTDLHEVLDGATERLDDSIAALRRFIFDLHPPVWADRRLDREIGDVVREMSIAYRFDVQLTTQGDFEGISELTVDTAALVVREALSNALRHAEATVVGVEVDAPSGQPVSIAVRDDGMGFDSAAVRHGMGLGNMQQRVERRGGEAHLSTEPGEGTTVTIRLPR